MCNCYYLLCVLQKKEIMKLQNINVKKMWYDKYICKTNVYKFMLLSKHFKLKQFALHTTTYYGP